jgi:hypothetical protein
LVNVMSADHVPAATPLSAIATRNCPAAQVGAEGIGPVGLGDVDATAGLAEALVGELAGRPAAVGWAEICWAEVCWAEVCWAEVGAVRPAASAGLVAHAVNASSGVSRTSFPRVRPDIDGTFPRHSSDPIRLSRRGSAAEWLSAHSIKRRVSAT